VTSSGSCTNVHGSIARTVDVTGDWRTPLVTREAFYGARRFEQFQRNLGLSRNVLTQRFDRLVERGCSSGSLAGQVYVTLTRLRMPG
jgi:DNA-binding HxlR family transcriptional regulator